MKKVRVTAAITTNQYGGYRVVLSNGVFSDYPTLEDAQRYANYKNNEDADDPEYMYVKEENYNDDREAELANYYARKEKEKEARERRRAERKAREESNRKSKKTDEKYVFVVSCYERGVGGVVYLQGETNLTKITKRYGGGFITTKETEAKVFNTKAAAQKFVDTISKCWMVNSLFRDIKVVQKRKDKMGMK
jgi:hypothetical protein